MKPGSTPKPWLSLGIAALLSLGGSHAARAAETHTGAWGLISTMGTLNPIYDAIRLATGDPVNPNVHDNLIYVNMDMQYNYPSYQVWESATWRPASSFPTQRFPASLIGTDEFTQPIKGRYIELRNLTLDRTDLDAQNVEFRFSPLPPVPGTTTSLTLNNGSLTALNPPGFYVDSNFTLTAAGDSTLSDWGHGRVSSQTNLNVTPGGKLTLFRLGDFENGTTATDSWYFDHYDNVATIDAATLKLDQSFVTFGKPEVNPGEERGKMTFQNNALLDIVGEGGRLESGDFSFINSGLNLGSVNKLRSVGTMTINGATVTTDENSKLVTDALDVFGTNTFALGKETRTRDYIATTGAMLMKPGSILTLNGQGSLAVTFGLTYNDPASGQIVINDRATLVSDGATFDIKPSSPITINRDPIDPDVFGELAVRYGGTLYLKAAPSDNGHVTNYGEIGVSSDGALVVLGPVDIQGDSKGLIVISDDGVLTIGNQGTQIAATESLTTDNTVYLQDFSRLELTLDPTAVKNGQLRLGSTLNIEPFADLKLALFNDKVLTAGTKFTLIDYAALGAGDHFNGYPEGHIFGLGKNSYRINYADNADDPSYAHAITLTVVDEPTLSPAVRQVAGVAGSPLTPTSAFTPVNFSGGCVLVYSSSALPPNLSIASDTGIITGTPVAAQTAANITITGTGTDSCSSQSATATVTLTIAATQTITFDVPPPSPTFTPNGTFDVNATATLGAPVVYSSLTPLVCTTSGSKTITMLSAGLCTIAANQPGNAGYAPAPQATEGITIGSGTQTALVLIASPPSVAVSGTSQLQTTGGSGTGLVTYNWVSGPCNLAGNILTGTAVGSCVFTATKAADTNYTETTSAPITVNVTAVPLAVVYPTTPLVIGKPVSLPPTVTGTTGPMTYTALSDLPPGLTLNPQTGVISGTPTGPAGQFTVGIKATDGTSTVVKQVTIVIQGSPIPNPIPTLGEWGAMIMAMMMLLIGGQRRLFGR